MTTTEITPGATRYTFTRDQLTDALTNLEVTVPVSGPAAGMVCAESAADALIGAFEEAPPFVSLETMAREFHSALHVHGDFMPESPRGAIPERLAKLRQALLDEEVGELREAVATRDTVKIADALADIAYVIGGTAVTYGIPLDAVIREVHRSNMTKTNTPDEAKLVKGPGYEPPRIAEILGKSS